MQETRARNPLTALPFSGLLWRRKGERGGRLPALLDGGHYETDGRANVEGRHSALERWQQHIFFPARSCQSLACPVGRLEHQAEPFPAYCTMKTHLHLLRRFALP